ncbi:MAG: type II secretion system F family protein [Acidimicrobiales bacterium]|nr:type II secretion system F family protein [Acidimicrobiales bacterium]
MAAFVFAALSAGVGLGVLLIVQGVRGREVLPPAVIDLRGLARSGHLPWIAGAAAVGLVVLAITGWPVAAAAGFALVVSGPRLLRGKQDRETGIARTQAIATWTETIRDNMAGAAGLEQALIATAAVAPGPIAAEVRRFVHRLDDMPLAEALARLGDDLDHPSADIVVAALTNAVRMESRDLGPLLTRLAESIRGDVRMRLRVEVGRARIRTSARIVTGVTVFVIVFLYLFSRPLLDVYDSAVGQLWLALVLSIFVGGAWLMNHYSQVEMPERFSARHRVEDRVTGSRS